MQIIFVIGAGRSGTTLLADLLGSHSDCQKLDEKRYLWSYGAYWRNHDIRLATDATPQVKAHISRYLEARWVGEGRPRYLIEKTPSNCLRIPFLCEMFPDAKYIHIVRDGRDVALSSWKAFVGEGAFDAGAGRNSKRRSFRQVLMNFEQRFPEVMRRIQERDLPPSGWLPYLVRKSLGVGQSLWGSKPPVWGTRHPGIDAHRSLYEPVVLAALQWREAVFQARANLKRAIKESERIEVRYEDLTSSPKEEIAKIARFVGIPLEEGFITEATASVRKSKNQPTLHDYTSPEQYEEVLTQIGDTLAQLGYR